MYFVEDKITRTNNFFKFKFGHKKTKCTACNGSGYYDHDGSPDCGCCDGTGYDLTRSKKGKQLMQDAQKMLEELTIEHNGDLKAVAKTLIEDYEISIVLADVDKQSEYVLREYCLACCFNLVNKSRNDQQYNLVCKVNA